MIAAARRCDRRLLDPVEQHPVRVRFTGGQLPVHWTAGAGGVPVPHADSLPMSR
ncbi:hypothetical protein [Microbispora rosea]|uniref:hypothetical protein n=1 Tax=Microbispora rosea TaxID=58117 RepID=UPI00342D1441